MQGCTVEIRIANTVEPDRYATCIIAQQYSSAITVPLRARSRNEKSGARLKNIIHFFFNLRISEIA
jgi:hypothetical protein